MLVCHLADDLVDGILGYILQPDTLEVLKPESDKVLIILSIFYLLFPQAIAGRLPHRYSPGSRLPAQFAIARPLICRAAPGLASGRTYQATF